jgi:predicted nucleic acid-binding protein
MAEQKALAKLVAKYSDLPMSLADACLVRMAEVNAGSSVFTLDGHFNVYRKHGRRIIPTIMPAR